MRRSLSPGADGRPRSEARSGFRIQPRDVQLLGLLADYGPLTLPLLVQALVLATPDLAKRRQLRRIVYRRLAGLRDTGYLNRLGLPTRAEGVFALTPKGWRATGPRFTLYGPFTERTPAGIDQAEHALGVVTVRLALEVAYAQERALPGCELTGFAWFRKVVLTYTGNPRSRSVLRPDGFFLVRPGERRSTLSGPATLAVAVEFDRGTERGTSLPAKIQRYATLAAAGGLTEVVRRLAEPITSVHVAVVTTSERRLATVLRIMGRLPTPASGLFLATTLDRLMAAHSLTAPAWSTADGMDNASLTRGLERPPSPPGGGQP